MRYFYAGAIAVSVLGSVLPSTMLAQSGTAGLSISPASYLLVSQTRVDRSDYYYTYKAVLYNTGGALTGVTATITSLASNVTIVAGQGTLQFSPVPAGSSASPSQVTSTNSFTILVNTGSPFYWSQVSWSFNNPFADPGPNQADPVLSTVTLNGSGSTNPSGIGSLTYSWNLQSTPAGSQASLTNPNNVISTFVPDLIGNYVIALTVSNGSQSNTNTITVSTTDVPPTANPGPNQSVSVGATVSLNGTKSTDADGQPLTYQWSFVSSPPNSAASLSSLRSPTPVFTADVAGTWIVGLVVNDGTLSSSQATVTITTGNTAPVAVATANPQTVNVSGLVQLDGSKSTDVDGNPLTYSWSLNTSQAPGSKAALSAANIVNPTFTADVAGTYVAQLIVNDGAIASQPVTVTISTNAVLAPTAMAGATQTKVVVGSIVQLEGSGSDPRGLPLTYAWTLPTFPAGSTAPSSFPSTAQNPTFVADLPGSYGAQLVVNDGRVGSSPATVTIASTSTPPVAVPTTTTPSITIGTTASLSGSSSYDPDNDPITGYQWSLSLPPGSNAKLAGATTEFPTFVPDIVGTYVVQLIVTDEFGTSNPATVSVSAGQMSIALTPDPLTLSSNASQPLTITLSPGAGASPVSVSLTGYDTTLISLSSNPVQVPANSTAVNVMVTPLAPGNTSITASGTGYLSGNTAVTITTPAIGISFSNNATGVGLSHTLGGTVTLSAPAPQPSGTTVTLAADTSQSGLVTISTTRVSIPAGGTTGTFTVTGAQLGTAGVLASGPGYTGADATLLVAMLGGVSLSNNLVVPPGQSAALSVQLSSPAPADGVTVSLQSGNTNILTVSPASVTISPGATTPSVAPQVTGVGVGPTTITASAGGYTGSTATVTVANTVSFSAQNSLVSVGGQISFNVLLSSPAPSQGVTVFLNSSTSDATVTPSVSITSGQLSASAQISGVSPGPAIITASSSNPAFSTAAASMSVTVATLSLPCPPTTAGEVGIPFSSQVTASAGVPPLTYAAVGGLPAGLSLNSSTGAITGTPTASGAFTIKVTDSTGASATSCTFTINAVLALPCPASVSGDVNAVFSTLLSASGGVLPYTYSVVGTMPNGLALNSSTGAITGTPSVAGSFTIQVKDAAGATAASCKFTINAPLSLPCPTTTSGHVNVAFSSQVSGSGGSGSYTYSVVGTLPAGLTLNTSSGAITGTPSASGTFNIMVTDSAGATATSCTFTIIGVLSLPCPSTTTGDVNAPFSSQVSASGGVAPFTYSAIGTLPNGLTLNSSTGAISGTPTAAASFTIQVKDSTGATATSCTFTISAALLLPCPAIKTGEVNTAFSSQASASGGATPYTYSVVGTLPNGLTLNSSTGAITGTPTAPGSFTVQVKDANGATAISCSITIAAALSLPCSSTTSGQVGANFSSQASASGGAAPYTYSVVGTLPNGLTLNSSTGVITGTPTVAGSFTVQVKDANGLTATSCTYTIASIGLQITTASLPSGVLNLPYSTTVNASGGAPSYTWTLGIAPRGLTINPSTGVISGTPTRATGTFQVQVLVTDSSNPQQSASMTFNLVVNATPSLQITTTSLPSGALNVAYGTTVAASGGTPSYTWALGTAPSWIKISPSTGAISGTPTGSTGTVQVQVVVTDSGTPPLSASMTYSLVISGGLSLPCPATTSGTVNASFSSQVSAAGGVIPYTYSVSGTLPNGLTLNSASGAITGTPTVAGTFSVKVTDSTGATATSCVFTIGSSSVSTQLTITTASLPSGLLNTAYSTTVNASGGKPSYAWALGTAPGWLQINGTTGMISGTPTRGTGTFQVQVIVTDSSSPPQSASMTYSLAVNGTQLAFVTTSPLPNAIVNQYYSQPISVTGGTAPYNYVTTIPPLSPTSWLIFDPSGAGCSSNVATLCGTPPAFGTLSFTITVTDSSAVPEQVSQTFSLTINSTVGAATISLTAGSANSSSFSVGRNLQVPVTLSFNPPPTGNVTVMISSSSPGAITFTGKPVNDGTPTSIPANSMQITSDAEGSFTFFVQAAASSGTITITASSPGLYASGTATVTLANSGFVLQGPNGLGSAFSTYESVVTPLTVGAARLDSSNKFVEFEQLANGQSCSAPLTVASSNLGSVSPTSAFFTAGTSTLSVNFTASSVNSGTGTVSLTQPSCASAVPATGTSVGVTVQVDGYVTPGTLTIGNDLQVETSIGLNAVAPGSTAITLQSNNPSTLQLWCVESPSWVNPVTGGNTETGCSQVSSAEIMLTIPQGQSSSPNFWMRGYASSGFAGYTISSSNYGTITANVNFGPSALVIQTPTGSNTNFSMSLSAPDADLIIYTAVNNNGVLQNQEVAADQSISVNVTATSGTPTVGTITSSPLTIAGATASASTTFVPSALGSATITASTASGFQPSGSAIEAATVSAGVTGCTLSVNNQITVGQYLEASGSVFSSCLGAAAGTPITITSNSPYLQLAVNATAPGSSSIIVTIPANTHTTTFWVYGMGTGLASGEGASPATATYTASAAGAQSATDTVNLAPSAVLILGPTQVPAASLTDSISTNGAQILNVITDYLSRDGNNTPVGNGVQPLAGNVALVIALTNGNPSAGTLSSSSVTINPGTSGGTVTFTPKNPNTSTTISETQPAGWIGSVGLFSGYNLTQLAINVTP